MTLLSKTLLIFMVLLMVVPPSFGTEYKYYTSREGVKCEAEGEPAYMGVIKGLFCSESAAGKECQNDKFCGEDEICVCNAKCESNRCIKGSREAEKTNNGNGNGDGKSSNGNGNKYGHFTNLTDVGLNSTNASSDACHPHPCNNGTCSQAQSNFTCICHDGWEGRLCEIPKCTLKCNHSKAQCNFRSPGKEQFCQCTIAGMTGASCESDINECNITETICHHGECENTPGSYKCHCDDFYTGPTCNDREDTCNTKSNKCHQNATCINEINSPEGYKCVCRNGYTGKYCGALVDNCAAANCGNGQCINKFNDYTCTCHDGYTGKNCETKIKNESCPYDDCDRTQCDKRCNIPKCNYDAYLCTFNLDPFKQCDIQECKNAINGTCRSDCDNMNCLYDSGNCIKPKKCSLEEQCKKAYGDGVCHPLCNTVDCGFDIDCISEPNLIPGSLVLEIDSTEGEFKAKKSQFEFELSRQLNSLVTVKSVRTLNAGFKRKRRSISNNTSPRLEVTMKMDNSKCVSQCFSTEQAARFLALKSANDDLRLPVRVVKVSSKPSGEPPITPSISPLWIALIVVGAVCAIGVIYGAKTVKTRFWKPEETTGPGKRETPIGQEELQILDESRDSKRQKLGFDHSEPFLNGMTDMNGMNGMHGLNINNMNNMNIGMIPNDTIDQQQHHDNPLHYAAHHGIVHILRTQMDYVDVNKRDTTGRTALHVATSTGNDDIFAHLIRNRSINPDIQDDEGETPLMVAVRMAGIEYVRQLVNLGSRTGLANKSGKTALHIAAMVDNYAAANILLAHSAKVDAQDNQMRTPLYLACTEDAYRTAALLVRHCANKSAADVDDITPLMVAQRKANHDIIRLFEANSPPHLMIPSPVSSNSTEMSPIYPDIRPKTHHMTTNQNHQNNRKRKKPNVTTTYNMDPLRAMPEWSNPLNQTNQFTINHQQQTFPFNGGSPFDTPSPYIVRQAELSPFSDTIPDIMTPPLSWTTSPNSEHEECG